MDGTNMSDESEALEREHFQRIVRAFKLTDSIANDGYRTENPTSTPYPRHTRPYSAPTHNTYTTSASVSTTTLRLLSSLLRMSSVCLKTCNINPCGEKERRQCYGPIIDTVDKLFPLEKGTRCNIKVLVPGA
ncbi:hypothetical protein Pcinc_024727, partial [Petrolisthes cinctipes]